MYASGGVELRAKVLQGDVADAPVPRLDDGRLGEA